MSLFGVRLCCIACRAASAFVLGSASAATAVAVSYPFDLMRTQFVVQGRGDQQLFSSIAAFAQHTQRTKGLPGFFAGLPAAVVGIVPSMGINFAVYEMLLRAVRKHRDELAVSDRMGPGAAGSESSIYHTVRAVVLTNGACGAVSGGVSKLLVYPLDTVKKLLQLEVVQCSFQRAHGEHTSQAYQRAPKYHSLGECVAWVYKHEGLSGYYKGVVPSLWKSVLSTGVMFASYQTIKEHLDTVL
jgi:solute carrier family 25 (mitochondrial thiamine pyrophosphate transporter), member 19